MRRLALWIALAVAACGRTPAATEPACRTERTVVPVLNAAGDTIGSSVAYTRRCTGGRR